MLQRLKGWGLAFAAATTACFLAIIHFDFKHPCECCKSKKKKAHGHHRRKKVIVNEFGEMVELDEYEEYSSTTFNPEDSIRTTTFFTLAEEHGDGDAATKYEESLVNPSTRTYHDDVSNLLRQNHDELAWVRLLPVPAQPESYPHYVTTPVEDLHKKRFTDLFQLIIDDSFYFASSPDGRGRSPLEYLSPPELETSMDLSLPQKPNSPDELLDFIRAVIRFQPHLGHPYFMRQNMAGLEPYSSMSDFIGSCINSNNASYILSTVTTLMEMEVIRAICHLVGYDAQGHGHGVILPGPAIAIGYAMKLAYPSAKKTGLSYTLHRPYFFVNERAASVYLKSAIFLGFGTDSVIPVRTYPNGKMDVKELDAKIHYYANGGAPCLVIATAGTPMLRAIDELDKIGRVCERHKVWFHVDATYGGGFLCSDISRHKMKGVSRADSFSWSPHFMLGVPCTSSYFIVAPKHKMELAQHYGGVGEGTGHAFRRTPLYDPQYDIRNKTLLVSRRPEMVKIWLMWKAKGTHGLGRHVDHMLGNTEFCLEEMKKREGFQPILDHFEGTNVCFWYVPRCYRGILQASKEYREKVSRLAIGIKRVLLDRGICVLSYNELPQPSNQPAFLVLGLHNSAVTRRDICYILDKIESVGEIISNTKHPKHSQFMRRKPK